jgi:transposase InsO family protein
MIITDNVS